MCVCVCVGGGGECKVVSLWVLHVYLEYLTSVYCYACARACVYWGGVGGVAIVGSGGRRAMFNNKIVYVICVDFFIFYFLHFVCF